MTRPFGFGHLIMAVLAGACLAGLLERDPPFDPGPCLGTVRTSTRAAAALTAIGETAAAVSEVQRIRTETRRPRALPAPRTAARRLGGELTTRTGTVVLPAGSVVIRSSSVAVSRAAELEIGRDARHELAACSAALATSTAALDLARAALLEPPPPPPPAVRWGMGLGGEVRAAIGIGAAVVAGVALAVTPDEHRAAVGAGVLAGSALGFALLW